MAKQLQLRKGTATEHNTFTGADGEVTVDTTNKTLRVHDGVTAGGTPLINASQLVDSTSTVKGVARFATDTEVINKSNVSAAITPKNVVDMFSGTFSQNGSLTLPSGHIVKWGVANITASGQTVSYPTRFPTAGFAPIIGTGKDVGSVAEVCNYISYNALGFVANASSVGEYPYIVIGY